MRAIFYFVEKDYELTSFFYYIGTIFSFHENVPNRKSR